MRHLDEHFFNVNFVRRSNVFQRSIFLSRTLYPSISTLLACETPLTCPRGNVLSTNLYRTWASLTRGARPRHDCRLDAGFCLDRRVFLDQRGRVVSHPIGVRQLHYSVWRLTHESSRIGDASGRDGPCNT